MIFKLSLITLLVSSIAMMRVSAEHIHTERIWKGVNGKAFKGQFVRKNEEGKYLFTSGSGGFAIAKKNLSDDDVKWIEGKLDHQNNLPSRSKISAEIQVEREWTRRDGGVFVGNFMSMTRQGYILIRSNSITHQIPKVLLSEADLKWIDEKLNPNSIPEDSPVTPGAFIVSPRVDRLKMPIINQADYGQKSSDCVPSTFCNYLLWWDQIDYLPIDHRGDFDKKAEWIHTTVGRFFRTGNTAGTKYSNVTKGLSRYFEKYLKDQAAYEVIQTLGATPKMVDHYCKGVNAVALAVSVYRGRKLTGGHWVALVDADADGRIVVNTWGLQIPGVMKKIDKKRKLDRPRPGFAEWTPDAYVIEFDNPEDLPPGMQSQEITFQIDPMDWDGLYVIIPSKYTEVKFAGSKPPKFPLSGKSK